MSAPETYNLIQSGYLPSEVVHQNRPSDGYDRETVYKVMVGGEEKHLMAVSTMDGVTALEPHTFLWVKPVVVQQYTWQPKPS